MDDTRTITDDLPPLAVSVERAAQLLGVSRATTYELLRDGAFTARKIGNRTVVPVEELQAFLRRAPTSRSRRAAPVTTGA